MEKVPPDQVARDKAHAEMLASSHVSRVTCQADSLYLPLCKSELLDRVKSYRICKEG